MAGHGEWQFDEDLEDMKVAEAEASLRRKFPRTAAAASSGETGPPEGMSEGSIWIDSENSKLYVLTKTAGWVKVDFTIEGEEK